MRHVPHPDAVPGHAAVPANAVRRPTAAHRLVALRHRPRRLSTETDDGAATGGRVRVVLPKAILAHVDLAAAAGRLAGGAGVPGDGLPLQAVELAVAPAHPEADDGGGVAASGRVDAAAAPTVPPATGGVRRGSPPGGER